MVFAERGFRGESRAFAPSCQLLPAGRLEQSGREQGRAKEQARRTFPVTQNVTTPLPSLGGVHSYLPKNSGLKATTPKADLEAFTEDSLSWEGVRETSRSSPNFVRAWRERVKSCSRGRDQRARAGAEREGRGRRARELVSGARGEGHSDALLRAVPASIVNSISCYRATAQRRLSRLKRASVGRRSRATR